MRSGREETGKQSGENRTVRISAALIIIALLLSAASRMVPGFAQWYSITVYPVLVGTLGRLAGMLPFSAAEYLCILLPVFIIADIALIIGKYRRGVIEHPVRRCASHILLVLSVLLFMYTANCGINYYRMPFVDSKEFESAGFTEEDLIDFCEFTAAKLQSCSDQKDNNGSSVFSYPSGSDLAEQAVQAMRNLSSEKEPAFNDFGSLKGFYPHPKQLSFMSPLFSSMGVSGIYSPFTIEANVNGMMTGLEKPFTACHELSHLKGFMNEGEANYIGWLACIKSGNDAFTRSGWIIAWIYAGNSLYSTDPEKYAEIRATLPDDIILELDENTEFWRTHETGASRVQDRVNDAYLKSNGQNEGIQTYSQLTTLMLMWYEAAL